MKRIIFSIFALVMALNCCYGAASAQNTTVLDRASFTLSGYSSSMKVGNSRGEIRINYNVTASRPADSVGVSSIVIYQLNGSYITTITGSTSNGLVNSSSNIHMGTYSYTATSGVSYYAKVTVFATCQGVTDSRTVTTATVKAP